MNFKKLQAKIHTHKSSKKQHIARKHTNFKKHNPYTQQQVGNEKKRDYIRNTYSL